MPRIIPRMHAIRWLPATFALVALTALPRDASARRVHVACTDGDPTCDLDRSCDGVCRMVVGADSGAPLAVRLRRHERAPGRRVHRVGRDLVVAWCRPPSRPCKPPLTSGCRADMTADECAAHDGDFDHRGLLPDPSCHCRTRDGDTPCTRDTDCQGMCLAPPATGRSDALRMSPNSAASRLSTPKALLTISASTEDPHTCRGSQLPR